MSFFFQAEDGIRDLVRSRGLGDVYKRQREAGARLMGRDRLGRDVFARGLPDGLRVIRKAKWLSLIHI